MGFTKECRKHVLNALCIDLLALKVVLVHWYHSTGRSQFICHFQKGCSENLIILLELNSKNLEKQQRINDKVDQSFYFSKILLGISTALHAVGPNI